MTFKVATVPVNVITISLTSVSASASVVIVSSGVTSFLQGYKIGVIARTAYMGIVASSNK